jgi:hypothetical protein
MPTDRWRAVLVGPTLPAVALLGISIAISGSADAGGRQPSSTAAVRASSGPCPGTQIEPTRYARVNGKRVGALRVYDDSSTGKNCARMDHTPRTSGKARISFVYLRICRRTRRPGGVCRAGTPGVADAGLYEYHAGPVITKRPARGRCIYARGAIVVGGVTRRVYMKPPVGHCGG